jgi:S1-C subfamily serine protease
MEMKLGFQEIHTRFNQIDSLIARTNAQQSSIRIKMSKSSGSGTLVQIGSELFISTNAHVVSRVVSNVTCLNNISSLQLFDKQQLNHTGPIFVFDPPFDLALIHVENRSSVVPAQISPSWPTRGSKIYGFSNQVPDSVSLECTITEINYPYNYQTNCGGAPGFSGTGYFDLFGQVVAVHRGQGDDFELESGKTITYIENFWNTVYDKCEALILSPPNSTLGDLFKECFFAFKKAIQLTARNPRTSVMPAAVLIHGNKTDILKINRCR